MHLWPPIILQQYRRQKPEICVRLIMMILVDGKWSERKKVGTWMPFSTYKWTLVTAWKCSRLTTKKVSSDCAKKEAKKVLWRKLSLYDMELEHHHLFSLLTNFVINCLLLWRNKNIDILSFWSVVCTDFCTVRVS